VLPRFFATSAACLLATGVVVVLILAACTSETPDTAPPASLTSTPAPADPPATSAAQPTRVQGTIVRFTAGDTSIDVTIAADSAATRDFLSMLPLTLSFEEFSGQEKISYLHRKLDTAGAAGHLPTNRDLIYFAPWGNLGFYYNAEGAQRSDQVIHIGTYNASRDQLERLEAGDVTVTERN
jgi:hypothetical protein